MKTYRYKFSNGILFFEKQDVRFLEKAALEGWHMKGINCLGFYQLEKGESKAMTYAIDVKPLKECGADFQEYVSIFEGGGWQYVCSIENTFHYFAAAMGTTPIYTDSGNESLKFRCTSRLALKSLSVCLLMSLVFILPSQLLPISRPLKIVLYGLGGGFLGLAIAYLGGLILNLHRTRKASQHDAGPT